MSRWMFASVVAILVILCSRVGAVKVYGTYEQVFQYADGQISTNQTAQLALSNVESGGLLNVGEYVLEIQSLPPQLVYKVREVGRIPKSTTLHTEEVCLQTGEKSSELSVSDDASVNGRRLLQIALNTEDDRRISSALGPVAYEQWVFVRKYCTANNWAHVPGWNGYRNDAQWQENMHNMDVDPVYVNYMRAQRTYLHGNATSGVSAEFPSIFANSLVYKNLITYENNHRKKTWNGYNLPGAGEPGFDLDQDIREWEKMTTFHRVVRNSLILWARATLQPLNDYELSILAAYSCTVFPGGCWVGENGHGVEYNGMIDGTPVIRTGPANNLPWSGDCKLYDDNSRVFVPNPVGFNMGATVKLFADTFAKYGVAIKLANDAAIAANNATDKWAEKVGLQFELMVNQSREQDKINKQNEDLWDKQNGLNALYIDTQNKTQQKIDLLWKTSNETSIYLGSLIDVTNIRLTNLSAELNDQLGRKFDILTKGLTGITTIQSGQFQQLYTNVLELGDLMQAMSAQLSSFIQQKQYNRLLTQSYWHSVDKLRASQSDETPLVSYDGKRPQRLTGIQLKAGLDSLVLVYNTSSSSTTVVQLDFYADTLLMLNISRTWTTIEQLVNWMGVSPCTVRADLYEMACTTPANCTVVGDWTSPVYSNYTEGSFCVLWAEQTTTTCSFGYNLRTGACAGVQTKKSDAITSVFSLLQMFRNHCNSAPLRSNIHVVSSSLNLQSSFAVNDHITCNATFQEKLLNQANGASDPVMTVLSFLWMDYMSSFQTVLRSMELIAYGKLPNGLKTEVRTLGYSPGESTVGFNANGLSTQCMRAYWVSVHPGTLAVNSLTFDTYATQDKSTKDHKLVVQIAEAPSCNTSSCYIVQDSDLRVNYVFAEGNSVNIPPQLVVVGDVTSPLFSGLYDVPAALVETTKNPLVRSNLLTYFLMPAGTERTEDFEYFNRKTNFLFDAYVGSASAEEYKFPVILDNEGYPVCNIASGLPVSASYTAPVNNCVPPFVWSGPLYNATGYTGAPLASLVQACPSLIPGPGLSPNSIFAGLDVLLFSRLASGINYAPSISPYTVAASSSYFEGGASWTISAWITRTSDVAWATSTVTLLTIPIEMKIAGSFQTRFLVITVDNGVIHVRDSNIIIWEPTSYPLTLELNSPVHVVLVFTLGTDAGAMFYDNGFYRVQLFANGALLGSSIQGGPVDPGALSYNSADPFSAYLLQDGGTFYLGTSTARVTTTSLVVENVRFRAWPLTEADVKQEALCGLAALKPRCWLPSHAEMALNRTVWAPTISHAQIDTSVSVFALHRNRTACLSATSGWLLSVSKSYDLDHPLATSQRGSVYSFTFWMRVISTDTPVLYNETGLYLTGAWDTQTPQLALSVFPVDQPTLTIDWLQAAVADPVANGISSCYEFVMALGVRDRSYHFYSVAVQRTSATLYVDGGSSVIVSSAACGSSVYSSLLLRAKAADPAYQVPEKIRSYNGFFEENSVELMYQYSSALSSQQVGSEMQCQLSTYTLSDGLAVSNSPSKFVLPLGLCTLADSGMGYCRHNAMCGGNCAVYASVDQETLTFTPRQVVCDPGWQPPTCMTRCVNMDKDGNCVTIDVGNGNVQDGEIIGLANAYSDNGYWCQILKNYQVAPYSVNGQNYVTLGYRSYQYLADITIPSGQITTVVPRGRCPSIALQPNGDGSLWAMLTNSFGETTTVDISDNCGGADRVEIAPYSTQRWAVPTLCEQLEVSVALWYGNGGEACQSFDATTVNSQLAAVRSNFEANVEYSLTVAKNEVIGGLNDINTQIAEFMLGVQTQAMLALANGIDITKQLNATRQAINALTITASPAPGEYVNPFNDPVVKQKLEDLQNDIKNAIEAAAAGNADQAEGLKTLEGLNDAYSALQRRVEAAQDEQQAANDALRAQLKLSNEMLANSSAIVTDAYNNLITGLNEIGVGVGPGGTVYVTNPSCGGGSGISTAGLVFLGIGSALGALSAAFTGAKFAMKAWRAHQGEDVEGESDEEVEEEGTEDEDGSQPDSDQGEQVTQTQSSASRSLHSVRHSMRNPHLGH